MQISTFTLYLLMKLDTIKDTLLIPAVILLIAYSAFSFIVMTFPFTEDDKNRGFKMKVPLICFASIMVSNLMPSTRQAATLLIVPKVVNSDFVQKDLPADANEIYVLAREYIKEQLGKGNE